MWELTGCLNTKINLNYGNIKMRSYRVVNNLHRTQIAATCPGIQGLLLSWASHVLDTSTVSWGPGQWY